jgi:cation:H+ antiporter
VIQTWIWFVTLTLVIVFAGTWLSRYGDAIAEKTGLGRTWVGVIMMATVTSLPELITGGSAVLIYDLPDIAAGDALGSCMFNVLILVVVDVASPHPISARVHHGHLVSGAFTIVLLGLAAWALLAGAAAPAVGWVGLHSALFIVIYLLAVRAVMAHEAARPAPPAAVAVGASAPEHGILTLRGALVRYGLTAVVLVAAATFLPAVGDRLAIETGLARSFVGNLFIAASTSLPEFVVSVAAVRLGAADLAVGNLFGSNLFNIAILAIDDLAYLPGPLFADVSIAHVASAFSAVMMSGLAVVGLILRPPSRVFRTVSWVSLLLLAVYLLNTLFLYLYGH